MSDDITTIPSDLLTRMRDLCPSHGSDIHTVTIACDGLTVTLTRESRAKADAELKRRKDGKR